MRNPKLTRVLLETNKKKTTLDITFHKLIQTDLSV